MSYVLLTSGRHHTLLINIFITAVLVTLVAECYLRRLFRFGKFVTLSPPIPSRLYTLPYWSNLPFLIFDIRALWRSRLSARVPKCQKIKNGGLDRYGAGPFDKQQFVTAGIEGVDITNEMLSIGTQLHSSCTKTYRVIRYCICFPTFGFNAISISYLLHGEWLV